MNNRDAIKQFVGVIDEEITMCTMSKELEQIIKESKNEKEFIKNINYGRPKSKLRDIQREIWKCILQQEKLSLPEGELGEFLLDYARIADPYIRLSDDEVFNIGRRLASAISRAIKRIEMGEIEVESPSAMIEDLQEALQWLRKELRNKDRKGVIIGIDEVVNISHRIDPNILPILFGDIEEVQYPWRRLKIAGKVEDILDYLASPEAETSVDFYKKVRKEI